MLARALILLVLLGWPLAATAIDLNVSLDASGQFDNNVSRQDDDDGEGDVSFRVGPSLRLDDRMKSLAYNLQYRPIYEIFIKNSKFNELSHLANGELLWDIGDKTSLLFQERFSFTQSINEGDLVAQESVTGDPIQEVPNTEVVRSDVYLNNATILLRHNFTPRTVGQFNVTHDLFESNRDDALGDSSLSGTGSLTYALTARDRVGFGGGTNWQQFDGNSSQPGSDTFTYRAFASWLHKFGESTELSIRGGPAFIMTSQDSPDPEVSVPIAPNAVVETTGTIDDVYHALGLNAPNTVLDLSGVPLPANTMIPAGSVLLPIVSQCSQGSILGDGTRVFSESNCALNRVAIAGVDDVFIGNFLPVFDIDLMFDPGANPGKTDDSTLTYFGDVSLSHRWLQNLLSTLTYSRSDSSASSLGSATIADQVTFLTSWQATNKLDLDLRGDWVQRKSANELTNSYAEITSSLVPGPPATPIILYTGRLVTQTSDHSVDTTYWSVSGRAAYRVARRVTVTARLTYQNQNTRRASTNTNSTFENVIAYLGVRYDFDPFHF